MPVETRAMKRAREAPGGIQTAATTAMGATTAATTTAATRAPRKKAAAAKGAKGTKSDVKEVKGKKSVDKVQKSTKTKKFDTKAIQKAKQKGKGKAKDKQVVDETEDEEPEPEPVSKRKERGKGKQVADQTENEDSEPEPEPGPVSKVKGKGEVKGKKGVYKVQKATKPKKGGIKAVRKANQAGKGKGKQAAEEIESKDPEPEPEPEPEPVSKGKRKGKDEGKGKKVVDKVQKSTKPKKGGLKAVWKAKLKSNGKKVTDKSELRDLEPVSKGAEKGKEAAAGKPDKTEGEQVQSAGEGKGKEKEVAATGTEGNGGILQRFTRAGLQEAGALESNDVRMPSLVNDIHPIWAPEKFRFLSATNETENTKAYVVISPALRLASLWIEQEQYEDFWATMWHGQYLKSGKNGRLMQITQLGEDQAESLRKENPRRSLTSKDFRSLASLEKFRCEWRFGPQDLGTWAKTQERIDGFSGYVTTLHDDFEWLIRYPPPGTTTSERLRLYFFLALNLSRELVWQVCLFKHRKEYGDTVEPPDRSSVFYRFAGSSGVSLDTAWEEFMFKGPIRQINSPMGPMAPDGLAVHHIKLKEDGERVYMPIQVDWISERFSMDAWLSDDLGQGHLLPGLPSGSDVYARELVIDEVHEA